MKKKILKMLALIGALIAISGIALGILFGTGVVKYDGGFVLNVELFNAVKNQGWFIVVFILLQVLITTFLCFVPATSMMFIIGGVALFGANWKTFLICFGGVILSSLLMDFIGRIGGEKIVTKLIGEEDYEKATKLVNERGLVYVPFMYLLPIFPDDAICMCCGVMKVKWWLHLIYIVACRGIGCATIVFGLSLVPFEKFTTLYDWALFITFCVFWVIIILFVCNKLNKWLEKRRNKKNENTEN